MIARQISVLGVNVGMRRAFTSDGVIGTIINVMDDAGATIDDADAARFVTVKWPDGGFSTIDLMLFGSRTLH